MQQRSEYDDSEDFGFDSTDVPPARDVSDPVPAGWYAVENSATTIKPTKSGGGKILEVEHTVIEGDYKGRKVWSRFNVVNASEEAQRIAREQLSALCHATGVLKFRQHEQLQNHRLLVRVVVQQDQGYAAKNEVKAWKEYPGQASAPRGTAVSRARPEAASRPAPTRAERSVGGSDLPF